MSKSVGIDLGTTNSVVTVLEAGEPTVIANAEGFRTTPSIVAFTKTGETLVGETAKRQAVTNVDRTIASVKRHMGEKWTVDIDGKKYTPEEISSRILQKLKRDAEAYLGEPVTDAVITVPAYFDDAQRTATKQAGQIAGLNVTRIVNEPTAAALAYGLEKGKEDETILVFDLGGGTFDVSLLEVSKDSEDDFSTIAVKATAGDNHLGGDDWDNAIVQHVLEDFKAQNGVDLKGDKIAMQRIKEAAEQAKKELSSASSTSIQLPYITLTSSGPLNLEQQISRAQFESWTKDLLDRVRAPFEKVLADGKVDVAHIDHVVLVGGSTRMPAVAELVKNLTGGKEPNKNVNPDEVVAVGAALQAGVVSGERKDVLLIDVLPLTIGIRTGQNSMTNMIERNSAIPTQRSEVFTTATDNQPAVTVAVGQGERPLFGDNKILGQFDLQVAPAPRGVPQIEVTFSVDANGILNVTAKDRGTGRENKITITGSSALSKADVERMVQDAETHAAEDKAKKEALETKDEGERLAYQAEQVLKEHETNVPSEVKDEVASDIKSLRDAVAAENTADIRAGIDRLNTSLQKIGSAVYGQNTPASGPSEGAAPATDSADDVVDAEIVED